MEDYSKDFIDYIKRFEDFKDTAYNLNNEKWPDGSLKYTIGYGTTIYEDGTPVKKGDKITKEAAEAAIPVYLNSKIPHIKEYITNWDKLPQQAKEGIFSIVYRGGGLRKSPKFAQVLNSAYEDGWMTTDEYQKVIAEMNFSLTGNLQDRMQRNAALIGGMYDYADNSTINYATTHKSPYLNYNNNVFFKGNKWNARWEDIQHMNESPANFVERLKDPNRKHIDLGNGYIGTHLMSYADGPDRKYIMYPNIQEVESYPWYDFFHIGSPNKELIKFEGKEALDRAVQTGDTVHILDPWTSEHYKQHYLTFKSGGLLNFENMNYINYYKSGSGIHIKKANKGKFTDYCGGKVTSECIARGKHSASAAVRKRATFAANARTWKHEDGGILKAAWGDSVVKSTVKEREILRKLFAKENDIDEIKNPFEQEKQLSQSSSKQETLTWDNLNNEYDASVSLPSVVTLQANPIVASNSEFTADKSKSRGYRNNNPLNIRISKNAWEGKVLNNTDGAFEQFDEMKNGWRAAFINMDSHISRGDNTLRKMIGKWAPTSDNNNPEKYASDVANAAGISVDDIINIDNPDLMKRIAKAMAFVENQREVEDMNALNNGWDLGYAAILKRRKTLV